MAAPHPLIERLYTALGNGDRDALLEVLDPEFVGEIAAGMPAGAGVHAGPEAMIADGWWAIGRDFAVLAEPEEWIECEGDRVLVSGRYRGKARATGREVDAALHHLWTIRGGRVVALTQITDTAAWQSAVDG